MERAQVGEQRELGPMGSEALGLTLKETNGEDVDSAGGLRELEARRRPERVGRHVCWRESNSSWRTARLTCVELVERGKRKTNSREGLKRRKRLGDSNAESGSESHLQSPRRIDGVEADGKPGLTLQLCPGIG